MPSNRPTFNEGDIALAALQQSEGQYKTRLQGYLGCIPPSLHTDLLQRLANHLTTP